MKTRLMAAVVVLMILLAQDAFALVRGGKPRITATRIQPVLVQSVDKADKEDAAYDSYVKEQTMCEQSGRVAGVVIHESNHGTYTWMETTVYCFMTSSTNLQ